MNDITQQDIEDFKRVISDFCKTKISQFIDEQNPDGNFSLLKNLLTELSSIGIVPFADSESAGYEYGVWGKQSSRSNIAIINSMTILSEMAKVCATFAMIAHIHALAAHLFIHVDIECKSIFPFLSLYDGFYPPSYNEITKCIPEKNIISEGSFDGTIKMGYGAMPQYALMLLPLSGRWHMWYFDDVESVLFQSHRSLGLRELMASARFNTKITRSIPLSTEMVARVIAFFWLGMAAISLGTALSAYSKAVEYANQRYQRGSVIADIESVQMLLSYSHARIETAQKLLYAVSSIETGEILKHAATCKLMVTSLCAEAVNDCLQVFGGYGYMEDFGMEKKFRDVYTLNTIGGSSIFLKRFLSEMNQTEQ